MTFAPFKHVPAPTAVKPHEEELKMLRDIVKDIGFCKDKNGNPFKVTAIKIVRTLTDWGLKEAKDFVEAQDAFKGKPIVDGWDYEKPRYLEIGDKVREDGNNIVTVREYTTNMEGIRITYPDGTHSTWGWVNGTCSWKRGS